MEKTRPHPSDASGVVKLLVLVKTLAFNFFDWLSKAGNLHKTRQKVGCIYSNVVKIYGHINRHLTSTNNAMVQ